MPPGHGAYVLPIDVPAPSPDVWQALAEALGEPRSLRKPGKDPECPTAAVPVLAGGTSGGHPVLLSGDLVDRVRTLARTARLDHVLREDGVLVSRVVVSDPRVRMNLNELADWARVGAGAAVNATRARDRKRSGGP